MRSFHLRYGLEICAAAAVDVFGTVIASAIHLNFAAAGFLHLLMVVAVALKLGFWPATVVSVIANLGMNFYLIPPTSTFTVADPQNLIALLVFEICALIVSRLSAQAQSQRAIAISHRLELEKLCTFSRRLLLLNRSDKSSVQILGLIKDEFATEVAFFLDGSKMDLQAALTKTVPPRAVAEMESEVMAAYLQNRDARDSERGLFIRVMRLGSTAIGAIGLEGSLMTSFLATAISLLCAIALERDKALRRESQQAAEQKGEQLRVAVLDALAHQYKTPLTVIRTAAGGLLELGDLPPFQAEMVELINMQTSRLNSITTELLQSAHVSSEASKLTIEAIDPRDLLEALVRQMGATLTGRDVAILPGEGVIRADRQLLTSALTQYLDNAAKYSSAGSPITISVRFEGAEATIGVHNCGSYVPYRERERIFDRFHRVPSSVNGVAGTGIGLSIVRKVALAHDGKVWVTSDAESGTTFFISLPLEARAWI